MRDRTMDDRVVRTIERLGGAHRIEIQRELGMMVFGAGAISGAAALRRRLARLEAAGRVLSEGGEYWAAADAGPRVSSHEAPRPGLAKGKILRFGGVGVNHE